MSPELAKYLKWFSKYILITGTILLIGHFDRVDRKGQEKLVQDFLSIMRNTTEELVLSNLILERKVLKDFDPR